MSQGNLTTKKVACEGILRGSALPCLRPAKWLTPLHRFASFQLKVWPPHEPQPSEARGDDLAGWLEEMHDYARPIDQPKLMQAAALLRSSHEPLPAPCSECERLRAGLSLIATDEHRLMNITARMTAESILSGKPIGAPVTKEIGHE